MQANYPPILLLPPQINFQLLQYEIIRVKSLITVMQLGCHKFLQVSNATDRIISSFVQILCKILQTYDPSTGKDLRSGNKDKFSINYKRNRVTTIQNKNETGVNIHQPRKPR